MSLNEEFITDVINHPEWENIRDEVDPNTFGEICWWVNNGPCYCQGAPAEIKIYLRRLNAI